MEQPMAPKEKGLISPTIISAKLESKTVGRDSDAFRRMAEV
jgi:hypothetical protein